VATGERSRVATSLRTPLGLSALLVVTVLVVLAVVAPMLWGDAARTPNVPDMLQGSSSEHLLGTDNLGRDMLARTLVATRLSLVLALLAVLVAAGIGIPLGALPTVLGQRGGRAVAALIEFWLAFPGLVLAIVIAGFGGLFLVRYSIEQNLLSPATRIALGGLRFDTLTVSDLDGDGRQDSTLTYAGGTFVALGVGDLTLDGWNALVV